MEACGSVVVGMCVRERERKRECVCAGPFFYELAVCAFNAVINLFGLDGIHAHIQASRLLANKGWQCQGSTAAH